MFLSSTIVVHLDYNLPSTVQSNLLAKASLKLQQYCKRLQQCVTLLLQPKHCFCVSRLLQLPRRCSTLPHQNGFTMTACLKGSTRLNHQTSRQGSDRLSVGCVQGIVAFSHVDMWPQTRLTDSHSHETCK